MDNKIDFNRNCVRPCKHITEPFICHTLNIPMHNYEYDRNDWKTFRR